MRARTSLSSPHRSRATCPSCVPWVWSGARLASCNHHTMSSQVTLSVTGMHCASCSALITRALKKTAGVEDAHVNLAAAKAHVVFDPAAVREDQLVKAVQGAGYGAAVHDPPDHQTVERDRRRE